MSKLSKFLFGTAIAGAAVAGTVAYLKKQENSGAKDELKGFKEHQDGEDYFDDEFEDEFCERFDEDFEEDDAWKTANCECGCSHKQEYKAIAVETLDDMCDIVVDTAKSLTTVMKDAYAKVRDVKENVVCQEEAYFDDLEDEFEEFDEALENTTEDAKILADDIASEIKEEASQITDVVKKDLHDIASTTSEATERIFDGSKEKITEFKQNVAHNFSNVASKDDTHKESEHKDGNTSANHPSNS